MNNCKQISLVFLILTISCLEMVSFSVLSQENLAKISLEPMDEFHEINPGQSKEGEFLVINRGKEKVTLGIDLKDFDVKTSGGIDLKKAGSGKQSLADFISYSTKQIVLNPDETKKIKYRIKLPPDESGVHWAAFVVKTKENMGKSLKNLNQNSDLRYRVKLDLKYVHQIVQYPLVAPPAHGEMTNIEVMGEKSGDSKNLTVKVKFNNTSNTIEKCQVHLEVRGSNGNIIEKYNFPENRLVLPKSTRVFVHTFQDVAMPPGQYPILAIIDYGGSKKVGGQYLATVKS